MMERKHLWKRTKEEKIKQDINFLTKISSVNHVELVYTHQECKWLCSFVHTKKLLHFFGSFGSG